MSENRIAMFELAFQGGDVKVMAEEHYQLVPAADITADDLAMYSVRKK